MAPLMKADMTEMPTPLPPTTSTSTASRRRLKYCPTINEDESLVSPTPIPVTDRGDCDTRTVADRGDCDTRTVADRGDCDTRTVADRGTVTRAL